ncbi:MAG: TIGR03905 family TSCPD domain-containing protein [Eubacterium sp.]|jgi:uncharacterized protein (TIGR03905 family)|uniref:TIGR03905 family TSCPD domain-containing protein n=1 Tax=Clostridium sp. (strain SY8519) TaxID=1042156 RepID=UPI0003141073|nr:TIGR03905 family TSCPD domain-containing protein [Clostridium sp. SY8519]
MHYRYRTSGTCSQMIEFDLENGTVSNVTFLGGCNGNLQGIGRLVDGKTPEEISETLEGISCGGRPTSCPDQLAKAVKLAQAKETGA